jgi:hypothetical protein
MEGPIKNTKILGIVVALTDILTGNLPNKSPDRYRCEKPPTNSLCVPRVRG